MFNLPRKSIIPIPCHYPGCTFIMQWNQVGRRPRICPECRLKVNRERAIRQSLERTAKRRAEKALLENTMTGAMDQDEVCDTSITMHPPQQRFIAALKHKQKMVGQPMDYMLNVWAKGQAGQQFFSSFPPMPGMSEAGMRV